MARVRFKLNRSGVRELMRSAEMQAVCKDHAAAILQSCGEGYKMDAQVGKNRANAMVYADTNKAIRDNIKNNTLLKALK